MVRRIRIFWLRRRLRHRDDWVREESVYLLSRYRDPADLPAMLALLDDEEGGVADVAQLCIQDYGTVAVPFLLGKLADGGRGSLNVIEALGEIGDERAIGPLTEVAASWPDETDRRWAAEALEKIRARG